MTKPRLRLLAALGIFCAATPMVSAAPSRPVLAPDPPTPAVDRLEVDLGGAAFGRSGALRVHVVDPGRAVRLDLEWSTPPLGELRYHWRPVLGTTGAGVTGTAAGGVVPAPVVPGVYELELRQGMGVRDFAGDLRVVVTVPFESKRNGRIGPYHLGNWPTEGKRRSDPYAPPSGFIEVTPSNRHLPLSEHFTVGDFLTKDQEAVWPKYAAVDPRLIDKLELVLLELRAMGVRADRMTVMSGFRTPQYNRFRLNNSPTSLSRHQFGDAADVWVDNDGDGTMSDLNGDGRRDIQDARVILRAVERVETRYPDLVGGAGVYRANRVRGPFIHIDVRGARARW